MAKRKKRSGGGLTSLVVGVLLLWYFLDSATNGNGLLTVIVLVGIAVAAIWLVRRLSGPKTATAQELAQRFATVGLMSGAQFEHFIADLFRAMGHRATVLGGSGDQGVDVIVDLSGKRIAIQCKNYKRTVGNKPVQEVFAGARHHRCHHAWVAAPGGFTKGAYELARSVGVSLFDTNSIRKWIRQVDDTAKQSEQESATNGKTPDDSFRPLEL